MALMATLLSICRGQSGLSWELARTKAHDVHQALHKLSVKTVTWAAQEEEELARAPPQENAQSLAGGEHVMWQG